MGQGTLKSSKTDQGPSGRPGTGRGTLGVVQDGQRTLKKVRDGSGGPRGGPGRVRGT